MRLIPCLALAACLSSLAAPARAFIAPMVPVEDAMFVRGDERLQLVAIDIEIAQLGVESGASQWLVDLEARFRNVSAEAINVDLAILDEAVTTGQTQVWIDGERAARSPLTPRQDPGFVAHTYEHVQHVATTIEHNTEQVVRATFQVSGTIDAVGRTFIELPTHALGLFAEDITFGHLRVTAVERMVGPQSTLSEPVVYDAPLNEVTWTLRDWAPMIPFRMSYSTPWAALLLVAEVEACPGPWEIVRMTSRGEMANLRRMLNDVDDATLTFCANLPEILHGREFTSERTRTQLQGMTLDRYVPSAGPVPVYRPNPTYSEAQLSDAEGIYARTLRQTLAARP